MQLNNPENHFLSRVDTVLPEMIAMAWYRAASRKVYNRAIASSSRLETVSLKAGRALCGFASSAGELAVRNRITGHTADSQAKCRGCDHNCFGTYGSCLLKRRIKSISSTVSTFNHLNGSCCFVWCYYKNLTSKNYKKNQKKKKKV